MVDVLQGEVRVEGDGEEQVERALPKTEPRVGSPRLH
ncbi:unannotated protein [freshwater metagenome]|uniref:Unannotated protein n=1 Tax=freshwater metagenome TaxID=449393 RepID=A0A6J6FLJ2_9ZZZZ